MREKVEEVKRFFEVSLSIIVVFSPVCARYWVKKKKKKLYQVAWQITALKPDLKESVRVLILSQPLAFV